MASTAPLPCFNPADQLNVELETTAGGAGSSAQLLSTKSSRHLPGQPRVRLETEDVLRYLESEFLVPDLDRLTPRLWLVSVPEARLFLRLCAR